VKKRIAAATMAASLFVGAGLGIATADEGTKNDHGICTAYFNGQKSGHDKKAEPGPFAELEETGDIQAIYDYCSGLEKGIGGSPDENGRFTDCFTDTNDDASDDCTDGS
jgi:hypothetical protein